MSKALACLMSTCAISVVAFLLPVLPVIVPSRAFAAAVEKSVSVGPASKKKVDINTADRATLQRLPGVGRVKAEAIIAGRPYLRMEGIMNVKGIKQKTFEGICDQIEVR